MDLRAGKGGQGRDKREEEREREEGSSLYYQFLEFLDPLMITISFSLKHTV